MHHHRSGRRDPALRHPGLTPSLEAPALRERTVFDFEALIGSPCTLIHFPRQDHNDHLRTEVAALVPKGLPYGAKLTASLGSFTSNELKLSPFLPE